jgi:hypothetical protein
MRRADKLTAFMCRLSRNLEASTSWNPKGLSRPVMGLLYFYHFVKDNSKIFNSFTVIYPTSPAHKFLHDNKCQLDTDFRIIEITEIKGYVPQ